MSNTGNVKLEQDSPAATPLQNHLNDVNGAIAKLGGDPTSNPGNAPNELFDGIATGGSMFLAGAASFIDGYGGANSNPAQVSRFTGPINSTQNNKNKAESKPEPIPLTPLGKTAKSTVQPGGKSIFAHERLMEMARIAKTSLTGVIKGLKVTKDIVKQLTELRKEKTNTLRALDGVNRYDNSPRRVEADEKNDSQILKDVKKDKPNIKSPQKPKSASVSA